jgi:two-component system nitrogen regulation response regulator GlnG
MPTLLVIDDDPEVLYSVERSLRGPNLRVLSAATAQEGIAQVRQQRPNAVILDVRLPDMSGLEAVDRIRAIDPQLPIVMITAFATTETAIEAIKRGAFEYMLKPVELQQLRDVVAQAVELSRLRHVPAVFEEEAADEMADRIVGRSPAMQAVYKAIGRVAPLDVTVLVLGESGTGKELVARALFHHGRRCHGPFLALNCAAIPEPLLESELFGHERGAFTGADRRRIGKFEQADHGTLLLDEIGDMSPPTQAKLLRLLQEQRFDRLGGNETVESDVRVIAATNQNLEAAVAAGRFRQDLYYRLRGYTIQLPSLREHLEDLPLLVEHFVACFNRELGKFVRGVSPATLAALAGHDWPGNVRELQNVLRHALIHAPGDTLTPDLLPNDLFHGPRESPPPSLDVGRLVQNLLRDGTPDVYRRVCLEVDRVVLEAALQHSRGNQVLASELLGMSRNTLRAKLRSLGLVLQKQLLPESERDDQILPSEPPGTGGGEPEKTPAQAVQRS